MPLSGRLVVFFLTFIALCQAQCALYGTCGRRSVFGGPLPCTNITDPVVPSSEDAALLLKICGSDFPTDLVCCSLDQIKTLQNNLKRVDPLISSCPACKKNFYRFFCEFLCSSNLAEFVDITKTTTAVDTGLEIVAEISQYVNDSYANAFFDLCKGVKFSATNGFAMDLIGGSAKNYKQFLKFLGDEKPLLGGSPFQINFKYEQEAASDGFLPRSGDMKPCSDPIYRCACSDCDLLCPTLPFFGGYGNMCKVAGIACFTGGLWSFATVIIVVGGLFHVWLFRKRARERKGLVIVEEGAQANAIEEVDTIEGGSDETEPTNASSRSSTAVNSSVLRESSEDPDGFLSKAHVALENSVASWAYRCALNPFKTIVLTIIICSILCFGIVNLKLETNPVKLWVSPSEPALLEKQYYEEQFGEFYRIEQVIIASKNQLAVLNWDTLEWWFAKEKELTQFENSRLDNLCFKPLGEDCLVESFTQYFHGDINELTQANWRQKFQSCTLSPVNCLPTFQQPLKPSVLFGNVLNPLDSQAFVVTLLLNANSSDTAFTKAAVEYEQKLLTWIQSVVQPEAASFGLDVFFSTESSLEEELGKSAKSDISIVVASYICMFIYALFALAGKLPQVSKQGVNVLLDTRFLLGLASIILILLSVFTSAGICSQLGVKSTLIVAEVIPFLILAVGIDNVFLITHELVRLSKFPETKSLPIEERISLSVRRIGPSCFASATLQFSMFLIAAVVEMPAVRNFAIYLAVAVSVNFILQMTAFIALLSLDQKRLEDGRLDILIWKRAYIRNLDDDNDSLDSESGIGFTDFIASKFAPFTFSRRRKVIGFFALWFAISLSVIPYLQFGLDQRLALPTDSYLVDYFSAVYEHVNVGPPVYFVVRDTDVTTRKTQKKICGKFSACDETSLNNILQQEFKRSDVSTIAEPVSSWLDDFLTWLDPALDQCCRFKKSSLETPGHPEFCSPYAPDRQCQTCFEGAQPPYDSSMKAFPKGDDFMFYFEDWIKQPSDSCPLGGRAPYSSSVSLNKNGTIVASSFRSSHTPMRSQEDFILALRNSKRIVLEISKATNLDVFAFLPFYVFFVQYVGLLKLTSGLLGLAIVVIFTLSILLLSSVQSALKILLTVTMVIVDILAIMVVWGISLNAVSLVNLVISVGIAVEFTIHISRAFAAELKDTKLARAYRALELVGGSVLGGITFTKLIGVAVLAFANSKIFEVFYFRMWMALVVVAAAHGLCFLPVLLSF